MLSRFTLNTAVATIAFLLLPACTVYTEKRSEALSQAVYATAEGIQNGRFEKAYSFAEQAKRLAYVPKNPIPVPPLITSSTKKVTAVNSTVEPGGANKTNSKPTIGTSIITTTTENDQEETALRLVIPEFLKHAKIIIENSEEWNELLKTKEFKEFLEKDNKRLEKLIKDINEELERQQRYNNQMVEDLNRYQKAVLEKDLLITRLYIIIAILLLSIGGGIYLRIKGIL